MSSVGKLGRAAVWTSPRLAAAGLHPRWLVHAVVLSTVWVAGVVWMAMHVDEGWIPHDAGTVAQGAQRVLDGELPHRNYDTPYTGGLDLLNAVAFHFFGVRLVTARWLLLAAAAAFIPAVYAIAARVVRPVVAGLITLVAVAWGLPNYFEALPSWYNLFCATFGVVALLRHLDTGRRRWLVVAGLAGGVSCLFKLIGLYYIAAAGLFLIYREQSLSAQQPTTGRRPAHVLTILTGLALFDAMLLALVAYHPATMELLHFALPGIALTGVLAWNEVRLRQQERAAQSRWLAQSLGCLALGVLLPVAAFSVPYALVGSLDDLWRGVIVLPTRRFEEATVSLPALWTLVGATPLAVGLAAALLSSRRSLDNRHASSWRRDKQRRRPRSTRSDLLKSVNVWTIVGVTTAAVGATIVLGAGAHELVYRAVWGSARAAIPLSVVVGCVWLAWSGRGREWFQVPSQQLFLVLSMAAMVSLVQVPMSHAIYFCYTAPLAALAYLYVVRCRRERTPPALLALAGFYLAFPLVWLHDALPHTYGWQYTQLEQHTPMELARSGLCTDEVTAPLYRDLIEEVRRLSPNQPYIFAGPDCPEIYFLAGKRNPTRTFFGVFDEDYGTPQREARILRTLDKRGVNVAVLKSRAEVTIEGHPRLAALLCRNFPYQKQFRINGQTMFTILWREGDDLPSRRLADSRLAPRETRP